jgi:two-component system chemotaxis response regulator CheY
MSDPDPLILVIEDNEFIRRMIASVLKGYRYILAKNGSEGIALYKQNKVEVVFLDIELPDINGVEVLKQLRTLNPKAFIVMVTINNSREMLMTCTSHGASGYIVKPFQKLRLEQYIKKYISDNYFNELF